MARYHCLFVDHAGTVFATEVFDEPADAAAVARANRDYTPHIGKGVELWRDGLCIFIRDDRYSGAPLPGHALSCGPS